MKWLVLLLILTTNLLADEDTATSGNILPNAGTTSSNQDNFNLDGVNSGTGALTNNSTHNGFTIDFSPRYISVSAFDFIHW